MTRNGKLPDYSTYSFVGGKRIILILKMLSAVSLCSFFFYRSVWAVPFLGPLAYLVFQIEKSRNRKKTKREFNKEFMECMMAVSVSLQAGYSIENAFVESRKDMETFFGRESCIYRELEGIRRGLVMHIPLEQQLADLGQRSGVEDIIQFANIFSIAKKQGGDMNHVIANTVNRIREKVELSEEIHVLLAGKEMEQQIMRIMPFGILCYIGMTYPGYFDPLYGNLPGIVIMSVALLVYLGAFLLGEYVLSEIEKEMTCASHNSKIKNIPVYKSGLFGKVSKFLESKGRWLRGSFSLRQNLEFLYPQVDKALLIKQYMVHKWICFLSYFVAGGFLFTICFFKNLAAAVSLLWYPLGLLGCLVFALVLFFMMDKDIGSQVMRKREALRMEYPEIVQKLTLYMGAGLSVRACFSMLKEEYESVLFAWREFQAGMMETVVYERFGRRFGIREYIRLGMLLSQNCRRGNAGLLDRLEEEALHVAKERQQEVKILGEKAQTKLLLPMVLMLFVVMLLIMVPAFMEM